MEQERIKYIFWKPKPVMDWDDYFGSTIEPAGYCYEPISKLEVIDGKLKAYNKDGVEVEVIIYEEQ